MKLKYETVQDAYKEFVMAFGMPQHIKSEIHYEKMIRLFHRELSKMFSEKTFADAVTIAWQQAVRLPVPANFYKGKAIPSVLNSVKAVEERFGL